MRFGRKPGELSEQEIRAATTALARIDLPTFVKMLHKDVTGDFYVWEPFHDRLAEFFARVTQYEIPRGTLRARPRLGKTEWTLMWMAWCIGRAPESSWVLASYSADLAEASSGKLQRYLQSATFMSVFPRVTIDQRTSSRARWLIEGGGELRAVGPESGLTGYGAGRYRSDLKDRRFMGAIVLDDPLKIAEARSKLERDKLWQFFTETLVSRRNTPDTPILVTGQRAHADDLMGRLDASGEKWENLVIPWVDEEGRSVSVRFPADEAKSMSAAYPLVYATQYQQRPYLEEGAIFLPDRIPIVPAAPGGSAVRVRGWDLGASTDGDFTAGALLAKYPDGRFVIEDMARLRGRADQVRALILATAKRDGPSVRISLPQDPGQAGKAQVQDLTLMLAGFRVESSPESGDKTTRALPVASQANVGCVSIVQAPWNAALIEELRAFDNGVFDDQVDALSRAFNALIGRAPMRISPEALANA